jgi:hypothetical protein
MKFSDLTEYIANLVMLAEVPARWADPADRQNIRWIQACPLGKGRLTTSNYFG